MREPLQLFGIATAAILAISFPASAQVFTLGDGNNFDLGGNTLDLGCHDFVVKDSGSIPSESSRSGLSERIA